MRLIRLTQFVTAGALILTAAPSAEAQFGGLMKKAREKVEEKTREDLTPVDAGEQLTDELVAKVIIGVQTAERLSHEGHAAELASAPKYKELSELTEANRPLHKTYDEAYLKIHDCRLALSHEAKRVAGERRRARNDSQKSESATIAQAQRVGMKYGKAIADAQRRHDEVALAKLQNDMRREIEGESASPDASKDSVAADTTCGILPTPPASLVHEKQLRAEISALDSTSRTLQVQIVIQAAQAAGLDKLRYLKLKERTRYIMSQLSGQGGRVRFGDEELAAVKKRMSDLEKVKRTL